MTTPFSPVSPRDRPDSQRTEDEQGQHHESVDDVGLDPAKEGGAEDLGGIGYDLSKMCRLSCRVQF